MCLFLEASSKSRKFEGKHALFTATAWRWFPGGPGGVSLEQRKQSKLRCCRACIPGAKDQPHRYFFSCCCYVGPFPPPPHQTCLVRLERKLPSIVFWVGFCGRGRRIVFEPVPTLTESGCADLISKLSSRYSSIKLKGRYVSQCPWRQVPSQPLNNQVNGQKGVVLTLPRLNDSGNKLISRKQHNVPWHWEEKSQEFLVDNLG